MVRFWSVSSLVDEKWFDLNSSCSKIKEGERVSLHRSEGSFHLFLVNRRLTSHMRPFLRLQIISV